MRNLLLSLVALITCYSASAQDPHFSQFFASPLTLSPAFTGKFNGSYRIAGNYRNQWPAFNRAFNTTTVAVDFPVLRNSIAANDIFGVGLMGFSDQSANSTVKFNYMTVSTAFHKGLDEDGYSQIGAGFQATYANMLVNVANLKFQDQLTPFGFTGVTTELFDNSTLQTKYWDINAGLLYTGSTADDNHYYAGVSMYHINRPKQQFTGALYLLNPRTTFHAGGYFPVGQSSTIHLSGLHSMQSGASETVVGGAWQYLLDESLEKPTSIYIGSWYRFNDAIIPYVGLEFDDFRLGASYDVNTSSLKPASQAKGGMEISLIYTRRAVDQRDLPCPKF